MRKLGSVTFDLDGTLLDTALDLSVACNRMLADMGLPARSEAEIRRFVGNGMAVLVERCLTWEAPPASGQIAEGIRFFQRRYAEENGRAARPYPQVVEGLRAWQATGLPLAVVTNKPVAFTEPLLQKTGLADYFQVVVGGDSTPFKKPHPEPIVYACRQLGCAPENNLHIGDSVNDALAAQAAGSLAYLVPYGYTEGTPVDNADCDALVSDLLAALRQAQPLI
ncbi:MAG: phosphoglycolate phosphatase [Zoogloeaceae bacterium]|jgi:phosphoglycolate phosphatase|nr:phosphoglycolate phosphatase [Zoogloeaceae bacterium]